MLTLESIQAVTFLFATISVAVALVARHPVANTGAPGLSLISYRPYCPVCDTVELNKKCLSSGASCMATVYR